MDDCISQKTRDECYKRDNYVCINPGCPFRDRVKTLPDGKEAWENKTWSEEVGAWVQTHTHLHHCLFRSRYNGVDRHEAWNLALLCGDCHDLLHNPHPSMQSWAKDLEQMCIDLAMHRREEAGLPEIDCHADSKPQYINRAQKVQRGKKKTDKYKKEYQRRKTQFMKDHGGLTPLQYQYRRKKELNSG